MKGKILLIFGIFLMLIIFVSSGVISQNYQVCSSLCYNSPGCVSPIIFCDGSSTKYCYCNWISDWECGYDRVSNPISCVNDPDCCRNNNQYCKNGQCVNCLNNGHCVGAQVCYNNNCCTPETESAFCTRNNKNCGSFTGTDNCGIQRTVNCGTCPSGQTCQNGQCIVTCTPATCSSLGKNCGTWPNNCGGTLNCGTCPSGQTCQNGQCRLVTAGLCSQYSNLWKKFERNETGGHDACLSPYNNCILNKIGSNKLFDHYCYYGNTIPIYRTMNINMKINLGGNLREKLATD